MGGIREAHKLSKEAVIVHDADKSLFNYRLFTMFKQRLSVPSEKQEPKALRVK